MSATLIWSNILAYSLQVGLLVAVAAFVPALVRMRAAGARLLYWQLLLAACLLLPWVRPWHREVIAASVSVTTVVTSIAVPTPAPARFHIAPGQLLLCLLAAGVVARLVWLAVGFWRLRRYRRRGWPLENAGVWAEVLLSAEISSPVTFGWRRPVILLPERFPQLSDAMQQAILCHENLHVERRDWLFTVAEELVRAALWFHPAIWWLLGEIQLAREQAVDCRVVQITQSRDPYVDALLEMAGARPELDLAPAPLFLRKRHLKQRVVEIIREATMTKTRWIAALTASVVFLAAACWLVTGAFPLSAAPQLVSDAPGVTVDIGGAQLMHRSGVAYPAAAIAKGVQGTVVVQVKLDDSGVVTDASIVSGPDELRKAVLQSVLNWHFAKDAAGGTRQVSVTFELPKEGAPPANAAGGGASSYRPEGNITADQFMVENSDLYTSSTSVLKSIAVTGISDSAKANLLARLPVHEGDTLPAKISDVMDRVGEAVAKFDPHLHVGINIHNGIAMVRISPDEPTSSGNSETPERLRVSGNVQALQLISHVEPVYPALAKQAQIQGTVELSGLIGKDGRVRDLQLLRGHPLLVQAALSAVKDWWVYKPTTINGEPVEVRTEISVNFTLAPSESAEMPKRIQVDGNAQAANLITQVKPNYPPEAKQAGIQGTVQLQAVLGKDGKVQDIKVLSGEPVLAAAALDAVKQWVYRPTLLNGEPVEVKTTIDVNFTLQ
jgi:TonB family protein